MRYHNDEDAKILIDLEIRARTKVLSVYGEVIRTVEAFDGKVLNKRLDTALKKIDKNLSLDVSYNSFVINYYTREFNAPPTHDQYGRLYLYDDSKTLCHCTKYDTYGVSCVTLEGKIISAPIVDSLNKYAESLDQSITELQAKKGMVKEYREKLKSIETQLDELQKEMPTAIKQYYDLYRYLRS